MYNALAMQSSQFSGLHYGSAPKDGYPCIKKGADDTLSGGAVSAVEIALGFSPPRSVFDDGLDRAVRQFQKDNGLTPDGIVGPVTGKKLGLKFQKCSKVMASGAGGSTDPEPEPLSTFDEILLTRFTNPVAFYGAATLLAGVIGFGVYKLVQR
jgi:peptidoglycan hydrolase-like protein with peptidoglycan-binding domain